MNIQAAGKVTLESVSVSVEKLAEQLRVSFVSLDSRVNEFYTKIDKLDSKLDSKINRTIDLVDGLAVTVKHEFDKTNEKIDSLDKKSDRIDSRLTNQLDYVLLHYARREEHKSLETRVKKIEKRVFA